MYKNYLITSIHKKNVRSILCVYLLLYVIFILTITVKRITNTIKNYGVLRINNIYFISNPMIYNVQNCNSSDRRKIKVLK